MSTIEQSNLPAKGQFLVYSTEDGELQEVATCKDFLQVQTLSMEGFAA